MPRMHPNNFQSECNGILTPIPPNPTPEYGCPEKKKCTDSLEIQFADMSSSSESESGSDSDSSSEDSTSENSENEMVPEFPPSKVPTSPTPNEMINENKNRCNVGSYTGKMDPAITVPNILPSSSLSSPVDCAVLTNQMNCINKTLEVPYMRASSKYVDLVLSQALAIKPEPLLARISDSYFGSESSGSDNKNYVEGSVTGRLHSYPEPINVEVASTEPEASLIKEGNKLKINRNESQIIRPHDSATRDENREKLSFEENDHKTNQKLSSSFGVSKLKQEQRFLPSSSSDYIAKETSRTNSTILVSSNGDSGSKKHAIETIKNKYDGTMNEIPSNNKELSNESRNSTPKEAIKPKINQNGLQITNPHGSVTRYEKRGSQNLAEDYHQTTETSSSSFDFCKLKQKQIPSCFNDDYKRKKPARSVSTTSTSPIETNCGKTNLPSIKPISKEANKPKINQGVSQIIKPHTSATRDENKGKICLAKNTDRAIQLSSFAADVGISKQEKTLPYCSYDEFANKKPAGTVLYENSDRKSNLSSITTFKNKFNGVKNESQENNKVISTESKNPIPKDANKLEINRGRLQGIKRHGPAIGDKNRGNLSFGKETNKISQISSNSPNVDKLPKEQVLPCFNSECSYKKPTKNVLGELAPLNKNSGRKTKVPAEKTSRTKYNGAKSIQPEKFTVLQSSGKVDERKSTGHISEENNENILKNDTLNLISTIDRMPTEAQPNPKKSPKKEETVSSSRRNSLKKKQFRRHIVKSSETVPTSSSDNDSDIEQSIPILPVRDRSSCSDFEIIDKVPFSSDSRDRMQLSPSPKMDKNKRDILRKIFTPFRNSKRCSKSLKNGSKRGEDKNEVRIFLERGDCRNSAEKVNPPPNTCSPVSSIITKQEDLRKIAPLTIHISSEPRTFTVAKYSNISWSESDPTTLLNIKKSRRVNPDHHRTENTSKKAEKISKKNSLCEKEIHRESIHKSRKRHYTSNFNEHHSSKKRKNDNKQFRPHVENPGCSDIRPTKHEKEQCFDDLKSISTVNFEKLCKEDIRRHKEHLSEVNRLKLLADGENDPLKRSILYLEAILYFLLTGDAMERENLNSAFSMYEDTLSLFKCLSTNDQDHQNLNHINKKLSVLSYRCQAVLNYKLLTMKKQEARQIQRFISDFSMKNGSTLPAQPDGESQPIQVNSSVLLSSPSNSLVSEYSKSSGYSSDELDVRCNDLLAVPPHPENVGPCILTPISVYTAITQQNQTYKYFLSYMDLWEAADALVLNGNHIEFFSELDRLCKPLIVHRSITDLVTYIGKGIEKLKEET